MPRSDPCGAEVPRQDDGWKVAVAAGAQKLADAVQQTPRRPAGNADRRTDRFDAERLGRQISAYRQDHIGLDLAFDNSG